MNIPFLMSWCPGGPCDPCSCRWHDGNLINDTPSTFILYTPGSTFCGIYSWGVRCATTDLSALAGATIEGTLTVSLSGTDWGPAGGHTLSEPPMWLDAPIQMWFLPHFPGTGDIPMVPFSFNPHDGTKITFTHSPTGPISYKPPLTGITPEPVQTEGWNSTYQVTASDCIQLGTPTNPYPDGGYDEYFPIEGQVCVLPYSGDLPTEATNIYLASPFANDQQFYAQECTSYDPTIIIGTLYNTVSSGVTPRYRQTFPR